MLSRIAEVEITIAAPLEAVFEWIVPIDLTSIFTGYGPLPAIIGTRDQTGGWDAVGQTRTVLLSDGSSASEGLTAYHYPNYFAYTVKDFTGVLRHLAREAHGQWWFDHSADDKATSIRWRYEFVSLSPLLSPLVSFITTVLWRGYMGKALQLSKAQIESAKG
jgi:hypothetical protein